MTSSRRLPVEAMLAGCVLGLAGCTTITPQAQTAALLARAETAMGSAALKTLTVTGRGTGASVGQAHAPGMPWPALQLTALSRSLNFEAASFREEFIRSRSEPLGGGAVPLMGAGEARGVVLASDAHAWDVEGIGTVPAPTALAMRVHDLWLTTPQGAVKAAAKMGARPGVRRAFLRRWDTLSFTAPGQFSATLVFEDTGLISRIESSVAHAVLGEMPVLTRFADYRPQAGLMLPSRILQDQGGFAALDLQITAAAADEPVVITVPENVRAAVPRVNIEKVADGVWFFTGGTHHSVAIEMATQIVVVEVPLDDSRARAVLDAANQLVPGKQAKTVINTHHHFDQAGGLRFAAASGATIYTSAWAKPYFEAAFASSRQPALVGVDGMAVLTEADREIQIHEIKGSMHARGLLAVWLPREQLLIEADAYTPPAPDAPGSTEAPPAVVPNANHVNLVDNLERLGLVPKFIVPLHGRIVPVADLYAQVGRKPPP